MVALDLASVVADDVRAVDCEDEGVLVVDATLHGVFLIYILQVELCTSSLLGT